MSKFSDYLNEKLSIFNNNNDEIEIRNLKFTENNIKKIAKEYDAKIEKININSKHAVLRDNLGRILFIDQKIKRRLNV